MSKPLHPGARRMRARAPRVPFTTAVSIGALAILAGCAGGGTSEASGVVAVVGSQECTSSWSADTRYHEVYRCVDSMSDARVSGTEVVKLRYGAEASAAAFSGPATLSNHKGRWRGTGRGAYVLTDPSGANRNYGRVEFRGEGAFKGLRYVQLFAGNDQTLELTGWIEPAPAE